MRAEDMDTAPVLTTQGPACDREPIMMPDDARHPSHWQANRTAPDAGAECGTCFHPKYQHNDDGRCRAGRHRCRCRAFVARSHEGTNQ